MLGWHDDSAALGSPPWLSFPVHSIFRLDARGGFGLGCSGRKSLPPVLLTAMVVAPWGVVFIVGASSSGSTHHCMGFSGRKSCPILDERWRRH